jgi:hypothetical protein
MAIGRAIAVAVVCSSLGIANSIIVQSLDTPLGEQQTLWINDQGANTQLYWAGGLNARVDGYARVLWCVQLQVDISLGVTYTTTVDWADTPRLQRVGWLVQNVAAGLTTKVQGAAFQLAIWDIMEDNGDGFAAGAGTIYQSTSKKNPTDAAVLALTQQYENQSLGKLYEWAPVYHNVTVNTRTPVQNLIGLLTYNGGPYSEAPEPDGLWLVIGGAGLIVAARWLRRENTRKTR